ncbi:MAG: aldolase/citrate lyase family protein [Paracoccaceae bacterium]
MRLRSSEPRIHPSAELKETRLGRFVEIGPRVLLRDVTVGDFSYCERGGEAIHADIGKFCSIAANVRINALDSEWGMDDLKAACAAAPDAILIPKVGSADDLKQVEKMMKAFGASDNTRIWAMMETPLGILNAQEIAASTLMLEAFVLGTNDLFKDLSATHTPERSAVIASLSMCLLAARAYGLICVDGVYNAFKDDEGLRSECQQGRDMGFDGKTLIHPAQLSVTNEVFAPSAADITLAQSYVDAFNEATATGSGVAVVNGKIVENLHVETAQKLLGKAATIAMIQ